jgi:hypothetical protein
MMNEMLKEEGMRRRRGYWVGRDESLEVLPRGREYLPNRQAKK